MVGLWGSIGRPLELHGATDRTLISNTTHTESACCSAPTACKRCHPVWRIPRRPIGLCKSGAVCLWYPDHCPVLRSPARFSHFWAHLSPVRFRLQKILAGADADQVAMLEERVIMTDYFDNEIGSGSKKESKFGARSCSRRICPQTNSSPIAANLCAIGWANLMHPRPRIVSNRKRVAITVPDFLCCYALASD